MGILVILLFKVGKPYRDAGSIKGPKGADIL